MDVTHRERLPFKGLCTSPRSVCFQSLRECRAKQSWHCFQSEHRFYIKRRACGQVRACAEGRLRGSPALKDLNLFKVPTPRALAAFIPLSRSASAHTSRRHRPAWCCSCGPGGQKGYGTVFSLQTFSPEGVMSPLGFDKLPQAHFQ